MLLPQPENPLILKVLEHDQYRDAPITGGRHHHGRDDGGGRVREGGHNLAAPEEGVRD